MHVQHTFNPVFFLCKETTVINYEQLLCQNTEFSAHKLTCPYNQLCELAYEHLVMAGL